MWWNWHSYGHGKVDHAGEWEYMGMWNMNEYE